MSKWFWIGLIVVVVGLVGIFLLLDEDKSSNGNANTGGQDLTQILENDHLKGPGNAKVYLIEYGDFQCPSCGAFFPLLQQAEAEFEDQIDVVFRHYPIVKAHPQAMAAHRAAEAAGKQGKFFEMHDMLYSQQQLWSGRDNAAEIFEGYAQMLGLNMDQYKADVASDETFQIINTQLDGGRSLGVEGTPTLFLNGQKVENPRSYEEFRALIAEKLGVSDTAPAEQPAN